jgi:cell division septation protein DedD
MRKLLLTTAIVLITSSAFAGGQRGLSAPQPAEPQKPFRQAEVTILPAPGEQPTVTIMTDSPPQTMQDKLKAAGELKPDGTPANPPQVQPPVQPAPVQAQPAPAPAQAPTTAHVQHKPAKKRVAHRGESNERKARRIAAKFGIYW